MGAESCEVKRGVISTALSTLASIATTEAKKNGKFVIPGVVMIKTRQKKATKAGKREIFGKVVMVKAKPAKTIVKAFPAKAFKDEFRRPPGQCPAMRLRVFSSSSFSRSSFIPPFSEEYACHVVQVGWRARGHAWPSGPRTLGEGDHMYSTSFSQKKK